MNSNWHVIQHLKFNLATIDRKQQSKRTFIIIYSSVNQSQQIKKHVYRREATNKPRGTIPSTCFNCSCSLSPVYAVRGNVVFNTTSQPASAHAHVATSRTYIGGVSCACVIYVDSRLTNVSTGNSFWVWVPFGNRTAIVHYFKVYVREWYFVLKLQQ